MATQLIQPNLNIKGAAGYCLSVQDDVWGVSHDYPSAIAAWNASGDKNHPNELPPSNVCVVVYWTYYDKVDAIQYGHIAAWVPGRGVFSSPFDSSYGNQWFTSIQAVTDRINRISGANSSYLGWSEELSGVQLVDMTEAITLASNQRTVTNDDGVNGRSAASTTADIVKTYEKGDVLDFKGFVHGQDPYGKGNDVWFVGAYSDTYWYSGAFSDSSTNGLTDLTPTIPTVPTPPLTDNPVPVDNASYHIVVNKKHPNLPLDYTPTDLVNAGNGQQMRKDAVDMIKQMQNDSGDGINIICQSGYRSYSDQETVYNSYDPATRDTFSARPGYSEHQTGLAMDFSPIDDSFKDTDQYKWLLANAHNYGFVLRYPVDKTDVTGYEYEPWHWRYMGTDATDMVSKGIETLEEYYGVTGGDYEETPTTPTEPTTPTTPTVLTEPWWKPVLRAILAVFGIKI